MQVSRPQSKQPLPDHAKLVFKGKIFDVYQWEQEGYDGKVRIFEKVKRPDTVHVFAVTEQGRILILSEQQPGTEEYVTPPGGRVDEGEEPLVAAKRELLEETGFEATDWGLLGAWYMHPKLEWVIWVFIARGARRVESFRLGTGDEKIVVKEVTFDELVDVVSTNTFYDRELRSMFLEAKSDPEKMQELRNKILGPQ
jgi:8-oxo-dGTP pyrophosphatase MutT (NUDIX family)